MRTDTVLIIGCGGHGKVVVDALRKLGWADERLVLADDDISLRGALVLGLSVQGSAAELLRAGERFHVAIGDNAARARVAALCVDAGMHPLTVIHPAATMAASAHIGGGCLVAAGAVVGPDVTLGSGCIVNHGAIVDHDCQIADACHVAPRVALGGNVTLGARVFVGTGATVLPGVTVGDGCIVGAGSVVLRNVPANSTVVGVPAKPLNRPNR